MSSTTTHSPADILRYALIELGVGTLPSDDDVWPICAINEPDLPDDCITVFDTLGLVDGRNMIDGSLAIHEGVQVHIRAADNLVGRAKAAAVLNALAESIRLTNVTIGDNIYVLFAVTRIGGILPLGTEDGTSRVIFTINAVVSLRQTT